MGNLSHANTRDTNESEIVEALEKVGISVERITVPCDLICGWHGETTLIEVKKDAKAPLTRDERKFHAGFRGKIRIVWTGPMAIEAVTGQRIVGRDCR